MMAPGGWPSEDSWLAGQPRSAGPPLCVKRRLGSPLTRGGLGFVEDGGRPIEVLSLRDLAVAIAAGADLDRSTVGDVRLVRLPYIESGAGLVATLPRVGSTGARVRDRFRLTPSNSAGRPAAGVSIHVRRAGAERPPSPSDHAPPPIRGLRADELLYPPAGPRSVLWSDRFAIVADNPRRWAS